MERSSAATQRAQALRAHFDSPTSSSPPPSRQASLAAFNTSSPTPSRSSTPTPLPEIDEASRGDQWSASDAWEAAVNGPSQQRQQQRKPPPQRMHLDVPHHPLEHHRLSPAAASSPLLGGHEERNSSDYFLHATSREQAAASSPVTPTSSRPRAPRTPSVFATPNVPATIEEGSEPGSPVKRRFSGSPHRDDEIDSDGDSTKSGVKSEGSHPRIVEPEEAERRRSIMDLVSAAPSPEREDQGRERKATPQEEAASTPVAEVKLHPKPSMSDLAFPRADAQDEPAPPPPLPASTSPPPSSSSEATTSPSTGDRGDASPQLRHQLSLSPSSSSSPLRRFIKRSFSRSSSNSMRSEAASSAASSSSPNVVRRNARQQPQEEQKPASPSARGQLLPAPPARDSSLRENRRRRRSSASLRDEAATASPPASPPQEARTRRLSASLPKSWRKRLSSLSIKREGKAPARLSLASLFDRNEVVASHEETSAEPQQEEADLLAALEGEAAWLNGQGSLGRAKSVNVPAISQNSASPPSGTTAPSQDPSILRPVEQLSPSTRARPLLRRKHAQQLPEPLASRPASVGSSTIRGHRQSTASSIRPPSLPTTPMTIAPPPPPRSLTRKRSMSHSGVTRLRPELRELGQTGKRENLATATPPTAWRFHATDMAPSRSLPVGEWTSALELDLGGQSAIEDDAATTILSDGASASPEAPRRPRLASLNRPTQSHDSTLPRTLRARLRLSQQESTLPPPVEFNVEMERRRSISERATRPRPTSLVLGPFDLQVPEMPAANDETNKEALRSLRHRSLPAALNIREKVLARRQYRRLRRSVDLALGLSVPLQLSFAAGLGWNEQATTVDDASESEATSADTDEAVTAPNTATFPSVDDEIGAAEEQQRRIAARKLSMDLLEGKASARQRATPSPSAVPVQPRSSSMAMAITVASLVDGPEWSAGKMRATIRRANTLAGPASAASTSSFYASASWSDVGEKRMKRGLIREERPVSSRRRPRRRFDQEHSAAEVP